jgi:cellobiose phosphorylase
LLVRPNLPAKWSTLEIDYRFGDALYRIRFVRDGQGPSRIEVDGVMQEEMILALAPDYAVHDVLIRLAESGP